MSTGYQVVATGDMIRVVFVVVSIIDTTFGTILYNITIVKVDPIQKLEKRRAFFSVESQTGRNVDSPQSFKPSE